MSTNRKAVSRVSKDEDAEFKKKYWNSHIPVEDAVPLEEQPPEESLEGLAEEEGAAGAAAQKWN